MDVSSRSCWCFFFFQAEDGIRDYKVTGVQTCALPIYRPGVLAQVAEILGLQAVSVKSVVQKGLGEDARLAMVMHPVQESKFHAAVELIARSEERRVGKECRSRGSPYH